MAKVLRKIEVNIEGTPGLSGVWELKFTADLTVGLEEYPGWIVRFHIPLTLTNPQEQPVRSFFLNVALPQAEVAK